MDFNKLSLEEFFYICFAGEGLAGKYCNNASGIMSKPIYEVHKNPSKFVETYNKSVQSIGRSDLTL